MDDVWNKKSLNDQTIYEYNQYQKYGYLDYANYTNFLKTKFEAKYGSDYTKQEEFIQARDAIQDENTYLENESV